MAISALVLDQSSHRPALFLRSLDLEGYYTPGAFLPAYNWMVESLLLVLSQKPQGRASLVAQWLRICLPMQGTRVRALVCEDPTCRGATRPVSHNY